MRFALALGLALGLMGAGALAQDSPVPERRLAVTENVDFYGSDLRTIFDSSFDACRAACLAEAECRAFTFNARSGACFPKSERRYPRFSWAGNGSCASTAMSAQETGNSRS